MANTKQLAKEKEMAMSVSNVYLHVVEDVINNVRTDFQSEGVDDNVLNELQSVRDFSSLVWNSLLIDYTM
jgi:transcription initiation factor TFIIA large subunit